MSLQPDIHRHADLAGASQALAKWAAQALRATLETQARASIALPGGSTPWLFLAGLAQQDLPWKRITLLPTDDRFVPPDHPRSNERMMRAALRPALEAGATWLSFASDEPGLSLDGFSRMLNGAVAPLLPLSVVVCGMGEDGHIASLFPGDPAVGAIEARGPAIIAALPAGLEPRVSLAASVLRQAQAAGLLFAGPAKQQVFDAALQDRDKPVTLLLTDNRRLHVFMAAKT